MEAAHARPLAIVLVVIAVWNVSSTWMALSYADAMLRFDELPGLTPADWLPLVAVSAFSAVMLGLAIAIGWPGRDLRPRWLTTAGIATIAISVLYYGYSILA